MGLQSAMTTALTGLQAAETTIDVVGNNVANSSTVGFKESSAVFATQFLQTQSIGSAPSDTQGGTNPRQIGLGVNVASITPDFTQGTIEVSSNPLDVAIQGDGFLIVQGSSGERLFTRNGQLQTNANNEIVTITGNKVLGYGVDDQFNLVEVLVPLTIPVGEDTVAQATENVYMTGVLPPLSTTTEIGDTPAIILSEVLGDATIEFPDDEDFTLDDFGVTTGPNTNSSSAAAAGAGSGLLAGNYEYRLTWFTTSGMSVYESPPSGSIAFANTGNQNVSLTGLPVDVPATSEWDGRYLYRSYDGEAFERIATLNLTDATCPDTGVAGGAELDDSSLDQANYSYYVTFFNSSNDLESRPTTLIGALAVSDVNRRIRIDNVPQPTSGEFDSVRIYRNTGSSASDFRLVDTIPLGETTYIDSSSDSDIATNDQVDLMGPKANGGLALTDVVVRDGEVYTTPFQEGVLSFTGRKGGRQLASKEFTIDDTTTVQDLITFMDEALGIDNPVRADMPDDPAFDATPGGLITDGQIQFTSNMGTANALSVDLSAFVLTPTGSTTSETISLAFSETQEANGEGSTTDFVVYDSLGIPVNVRVTTVLESSDGNSTTYRWYATSQDNEPIPPSVDTVVGNGTISFDYNGNVVSGGTARLAVDREVTASASPLEFVVDFSQVSGLAEQNSQGESAANMSMSRQDGFPPGSLTSFIITSSGLIRGVFSNGTNRPLGQMRMARFANNSGLQQVGNNVFTEGVNSGEPIDGNPGDRGIGALTAGAVELSNSDIGQNLIELILASTQYRGGARVITAAQQMLDELMALRR
jgi:flagellar hook protein FlgE